MARKETMQAVYHFPAELHARLKSAAEYSKRSMNAEAIYRLDQSFEASKSLGPEVARLLEDYVQREVEARLMAMARNLSGASNG